MLIVAAPVLARAQDGKLVLYTSQPNQDAQQTIDAFKAKYPKVDITFVRDGTPRIVAKLRAEMEAGAAQADILLIADAVTMEDLKKDGRLLPYPEADLSAYPTGHARQGQEPGLRPSSSPRASSTTPRRRSSRNRGRICSKTRPRDRS